MSKESEAFMEAELAKRLLRKKVGAWTLGVAALVGLAAGIGMTGEGPTLLGHFGKFLSFIALTVMLLPFGLANVYVANKVMGWSFMDRDGASGQMDIIRARIGTGDEAAGDADAASRQYLANRILLGTVMFAWVVAFHV